MVSLLPARIRARRALRQLPRPHVVERLTEAERTALYKHAVRAAWEDGRLRFDERVYLDELRRGLGLTEKMGQRIEERAYAAR